MKLSKIYIVFLMFILGSALFAQNGISENNDAKEAYNRGNKAYKEGRLDDAITSYLEATKFDPDFALAYFWTGNVYKRKEDYVNAEKYYQSAIQKDNKMVDAYERLGDVQAKQKKYSDALGTYQAAINIGVDSKRAYYGMGEVYRTQGNYPKAIENYQTAAGLEPLNGLYHGNTLKGLGISFMEISKYEEAASALSEAINHLKDKDQKADIYFRLGNAYKELGDLDQAEQAFKDCLLNARKSMLKGGANFGLGEIYKKRGNTQEAIKYYQEASVDRNWKKSADYEIDLLKEPGKYSN